MGAELFTAVKSSEMPLMLVTIRAATLSNSSSSFNSQASAQLQRQLSKHSYSSEDKPLLVRRGEENLDVVTIFSKKLGISRITAAVLVNRGILQLADAEEFLSPSLKNGLMDPGKIKNMDSAIELILTAIEQNKVITVYSDFDVDGLTSGTQLVLYLEKIGAKVNCYAPNRFTEGYGLQLTAIEKLQKAGTELLITVDCGIANCEEIKLAKRRGMQVLVLDHHQPGAQLPEADVIVDPAQPGCPFVDYEMCAAGLVWMLLIRLRAVAKTHKFFSEVNFPDPRNYLDLAAIGTICDMVPLRRINRVIAARGLEAILANERVGIGALLDVASIKRGKPLSGGNISFGIGPRINAAGRLDDARQVYDLLLTESKTKAKQIAKKIDKLNRDRKQIESSMRDECIRSVLESKELQEAFGITIYNEEFHLGVIGIVAQRLVEAFHKPSAVMAPSTIELHGREIPVIKGSVRSIKGFNVSEVLGELSELLINGGGHAMAGGFSLMPENLAAFQEAFASAAAQRLSESDLVKRIHVDETVDLSEIDFNLVTELQRLAPFGMGNPSPVLVANNVLIDSVMALSEEHLKGRVTNGEHTFTAIGWGFKGHPLFVKDSRVSMAFAPEINTYNGISSVQLNLKELWS